MTKDFHPDLVSIALCTYNGERFLREQLDSLLAQDWPHLEIVIVDDASTDGTHDILTTYARQDSRIRHVRNPVNLGYQKNFEAAILQCRGRWIAPCDQDDVWLPTKLSELVRALQTEDVLLAYCDSEMIDDSGRTLGLRVSQLRNCFSTDDPMPFLFSNNVSGHAMLFCRSLLGQTIPFPPGLFHDWWIAYAAASAGRICFVDRCLVLYRQHGGNITDLAGRRPAAVEHRPRGFRQRELEVHRDRIAQLARIPGKGQAQTQELLRLWLARENQFVSWRLSQFMWRHRDRLYAIDQNTDREKKRNALKYFWGLRGKQLVEPHRYAKAK